MAMEKIRAGTSQSVQRWAMGWKDRVRFPEEARDSSLVHSVQTGSGAHPTSYLMNAGRSFFEGKAASA
jgi:hypothetical protein